MDRWWKDTARGKRQHQEENFPPVPLSSPQIDTWSESEFNRNLLGDSPTTNSTTVRPRTARQSDNQQHDSPTTNSTTKSTTSRAAYFILQFQYFAHIFAPVFGKHPVEQLVGALLYKPEGRGFTDLILSAAIWLWFRRNL